MHMSVLRPYLCGTICELTKRKERRYPGFEPGTGSQSPLLFHKQTALAMIKSFHNCELTEMAA